jgi:hypothetical protein
MTINRDTGGLGDQMADDDLLLDTTDDIEVSFVDEDAGAQPAPVLRKGQNEDGFDEGSDYSDPDLADIENPKVRERIMRERRLRLDDQRRQASEADRYEAALRASEKQKLAIQKDAFNLSMDGVDVRIRTTMEALKSARSEGDESAAVDIDAQLAELRSIREGIKAQMERLPHESEIDRAFDEAAARRQAQSRTASSQRDGIRPLNEKAGRWQSNNSWMLDPARTAETAALVAINNQLVQEGLDAQDDTFFVELSRRMAKTFPSLPIKDLSGRQLTAQRPSQGQGQAQGQQQRRASSPPVASARTTSGPPTRTNSPRQVEIDRSDRAMMRSLGLDPTNDKAVKYYAKQKFERIRSENGRA